MRFLEHQAACFPSLADLPTFALLQSDPQGCKSLDELLAGGLFLSIFKPLSLLDLQLILSDMTVVGMTR